MIHSLWDLFFVGDGLEPIAEELSGGQFLPPVQTLVATLIFCLKAENANRVPRSAPKKERLWADSHRDLHGFERIFFPAENPSFLKYIQYFCVLWIFLQEKIFHSKLRSTPKREIFLQDKIKSHGKANAYRGFLTQYCRNRSVLERITPCVRPPFASPFYIIQTLRSAFRKCKTIHARRPPDQL